jgi:hypothetical protein
VQAHRGGEVLKPSRAPTLLLLLALGACASPRAVLVNDKGEYITCAGTSAGLISTMVETSRFERCVEDAKAKGYRIERQSS